MKYTQTTTYTDPLGHYSLVLPHSWSASSDTSIARISDPTGRAECTCVTTAFVAGSNDAYLYENMGVTIMMSIIDSPFLILWFCKSFGLRPTNAHFAGVNAIYREWNMTYLLNTNHAHFQMGVLVPPEYRRGAFAKADSIPPPPIPREQFEIVHAVMLTFTPIPNENLQCG